MENNFYVYIWFLKETNEVFYVGKGKNNRYKSLSSRNSYFLNIIHKYDVDVKIYKDNLTEDEAFSLEKELISFYKSINECKANFHLGGKGGNHGQYHTESFKSKLSKFASSRIGLLNPMYGKTHSLEAKQKIREANLNKKMSDEIKLKISNKNKGHVVSEETKKKISLINKGRKMTPEQIKKCVESHAKYLYKVFHNDKIIFETKIKNEIYKYFKTNLNISRAIVDKIILETYNPKFNKHQYLNEYKIIKNKLSVSTIPDECKEVE